MKKKKQVTSLLFVSLVIISILILSGCTEQEAEVDKMLSENNVESGSLTTDNDIKTQQDIQGSSDIQKEIEEGHISIATFAGGCFWCVEADFEKLDGVIEVISGFSGGDEVDPTYDEVSSGKTGHIESVQVYYYPSKISYEKLLEHFWTHINPTDSGGQFVDRGDQYISRIFYHDEEQKKMAEKSKKLLEESGVFDEPIVTEIEEFKSFYPAEDYHQDYYKRASIRYSYYRGGSGRDKFLEEAWKDSSFVIPDSEDMDSVESVDESDEVIKVMDMAPEYSRPSDKEIEEMLTPLQYKVTQQDGTEKAFDNEYWDNKEEGIYVDIVSGEPLFSSTHKYKSGTGWPSFWQPLVEENIVELEDNTFFSKRTEIRSKHGDSHLGHVFTDGPEPTGLRYCMNSASLRFVPKDKMLEEGYGDYLYLFE